MDEGNVLVTEVVEGDEERPQEQSDDDLADPCGNVPDAIREAEHAHATASRDPIFYCDEQGV